MLTRRGADLGLAILLMGVVAALGFAWGAKAPWLVAVLAFPLLAGLGWGAMLTAATGPRLTVTREPLQERYLVGDTPEVVLRIRNDGFTPGTLEVLDELPRGLEVHAGANHALLRIPAGTEVTLAYTVRIPVRGRFDLPGIRWRWRSPLGAFAREGRVEAPATFAAYPRSDGGEFNVRNARSSRYLLGPTSQRQAGQGGEFYGLRYYRSDDPYDSINWKASARRGKLIVNEHERESPADFVLVLDARALTGRGAPASVLEANIRGALSLAEDVLAKGHKVGLLVYGDAYRWIYPEYGRKQYEKILQALITVEPRGTLALQTLVMQTPAALIPARATAVLFSTAWGDVRLLEGVESLAKRVRTLTVVYPFPDEPPFPVPDAAHLVARDLLEGELLAVCARTRRAGAHAVPWRPRTPLPLAFAEVNVPWTK